MTGRVQHMLTDVHALASRYHWSERGILALPLPRRARYLALIEAEEHAALFQQLTSED